MDAKLNPISGSAAGTPLTGQSISAQSGQQAQSQSKLQGETVRDTLETSDREADGTMPWTGEAANNSASEESSPPPSQGGLLDLEG